MEPSLFNIDYGRLTEVLITIVIFSFFIERALSVVFESRLFIDKTTDENGDTRKNGVRPVARDCSRYGRTHTSHTASCHSPSQAVHLAGQPLWLPASPATTALNKSAPGAHAHVAQSGKPIGNSNPKEKSKGNTSAFPFFFIALPVAQATRKPKLSRP